MWCARDLLWVTSTCRFVSPSAENKSSFNLVSAPRLFSRWLFLSCSTERLDINMSASLTFSFCCFKFCETKHVNKPFQDQWTSKSTESSSPKLLNFSSLATTSLRSWRSSFSASFRWFLQISEHSVPLQGRTVTVKQRAQCLNWANTQKMERTIFGETTTDHLASNTKLKVAWFLTGERPYWRALLSLFTNWSCITSTGELR